jgi:hypothetical protein
LPCPKEAEKCYENKLFLKRGIDFDLSMSLYSFKGYWRDISSDLIYDCEGISDGCMFTIIIINISF